MSLDRRGCELPLDWCVEPYNPLCCPFLLQLRLFVLICLHRAPIAMVVFLFHIRRSHLPFSAADFSSFISLFFLYLCPWHTHTTFFIPRQASFLFFSLPSLLCISVFTTQHNSLPICPVMFLQKSLWAFFRSVSINSSVSYFQFDLFRAFSVWISVI